MSTPSTGLLSTLSLSLRAFVPHWGGPSARTDLAPEDESQACTKRPRIAVADHVNAPFYVSDMGFIDCLPLLVPPEDSHSPHQEELGSAASDDLAPARQQQPQQGHQDSSSSNGAEADNWCKQQQQQLCGRGNDLDDRAEGGKEHQHQPGQQAGCQQQQPLLSCSDHDQVQDQQQPCDPAASPSPCCSSAAVTPTPTLRGADCGDASAATAPCQEPVAEPSAEDSERSSGGCESQVLATEALGRFLGSCELQNQRPYQEDRTSLVLLGSVICCGLYDGHAGHNTSSYLQEYLLPTVCRKMQEGVPCPAALRQSFAQTNGELRKIQSSFYSGSTATVVVVNGPHIVCANAGDSPAFVVSKSGLATCLTFEHNPNNDAERARVQAAGGRIEKMHWGERYKRVLSYDSLSGLAMTRAFGDFNFTGVISDPHVSMLQATEEAMYLVVASDGLTEQWNIEGAAEAVCEFAGAGCSPCEIATRLARRAIEKGSRDNISVVVLDLRSYLHATSPRQQSA